MNECNGVIVISGPPGAGKSTIARLLVDSFGRAATLHLDDFLGFVNNSIPAYMPESEQQNNVVIDVLVDAAFGYAKGGYSAVVDGVIGTWFIGRFESVAKASGVPLHYVVLRPDVQSVLTRGSKRGKDALTEPEPIVHMYNQFANLGTFEPNAIDTSGLDPNETVKLVLDLLNMGKLLLPRV
jgi:deoxyadenosine/deoxycytidine kinase